MFSHGPLQLHRISTQREFEALFRRHRPYVYKQAYRWLGNAPDAEDITQEAFARAWANFALYDPGRSFEAWVSRIATNLCLDYLRRKRRRQWVPLDLNGAEATHEPQPVDQLASGYDRYDPMACLLAVQLQEVVMAALYSMPAHHRDTILMVLQEHSYEEIARAMGCPVGTIRSRVHRARIRLRQMISPGERSTLET